MPHGFVACKIDHACGLGYTSCMTILAAGAKYYSCSYICSTLQRLLHARVHLVRTLISQAISLVVQFNNQRRVCIMFSLFFSQLTSLVSLFSRASMFFASLLSDRSRGDGAAKLQHQGYQDIGKRRRNTNIRHPALTKTSRAPNPGQTARRQR